MNRILLDTNAYTAFKRGDPEIVEIIGMAERLAVNTTVLGELLAGFSRGNKEDVNRSELSELLDSPRVKMLALSERTAEYYAVVYRNLREKGRPVPTNDMWIAASALEHGLALLTLDAHFREVDNLWVGSRPAHFLP
jgi:tRNA(fMet)-specific endonuclease VapC